MRLMSGLVRRTAGRRGLLTDAAARVTDWKGGGTTAVFGGGIGRCDGVGSAHDR